MIWLGLCVGLLGVVVVSLIQALIDEDETRKSLAVAAVAAIGIYLIVRAGVLPADLTDWWPPVERSFLIATDL